MYTVKKIVVIQNSLKWKQNFNALFPVSLLLFISWPILVLPFFIPNQWNTIQTINQSIYPIAIAIEWPKFWKPKFEIEQYTNLQQLLLCATQSLFACDTQQSGNAQANGSSPTSLQVLKRSCFSFLSQLQKKITTS